MTREDEIRAAEKAVVEAARQQRDIGRRKCSYNLEDYRKAQEATFDACDALDKLRRPPTALEVVERVREVMDFFVEGDCGSCGELKIVIGRRLGTIEAEIKRGEVTP